MENMRIKDIETIVKLSQTLNIRELSRKTNQTAGQISKTVSSMEKRLNVKIFNRSIAGLEVSDAGQNLIPKLKKIYNSYLELETSSTINEKKRLTISSSSFFISHLLPKIVPKIKNSLFNIIALPPEDFIQAGLRSGFSICIHTSKLDWPSTWHSEKAGVISYKLYAKSTHPLLKKARITEKDLRETPFIKPVYWTKEGVKNGEDQFPKKIQRISSHKTSTALSAAELLKHTNAIGFLPSVIVTKGSQLKELKVSFIKPVTQNVYITVKSDEVSQTLYLKLISELKKYL